MPFHNSPFFRSTRYPSLLGGQRQSGMRGFAQHLYTRSNFSDLRELVTLPCATICVRQTASLYQQVLHCHSGSVVSFTGRHQTATPYIVKVLRDIWFKITQKHQIWHKCSLYHTISISDGRRDGRPPEWP